MTSEEHSIAERMTTVGRGYTTAGQVIEELKRSELFQEIADAGHTYVGSGDAATFRFDLDDDGFEFIVTVIRVLKDYHE
jgi:hypothetical protein